MEDAVWDDEVPSVERTTTTIEWASDGEERVFQYRLPPNAAAVGVIPESWGADAPREESVEDGILTIEFHEPPAAGLRVEFVVELTTTAGDLDPSRGGEISRSETRAPRDVPALEDEPTDPEEFFAGVGTAPDAASLGDIVAAMTQANVRVTSFPRPEREDIEQTHVSLDALGELNKLVRQTDAEPGVETLREWTHCWLAQMLDASPAHINALTVEQIATSLEGNDTRKSRRAGGRLRVAVARTPAGSRSPFDAIAEAVAYEFTRFYAPDYTDDPAASIRDTATEESDSGASASASEGETTPTPMSQFDLSEHVETETATEQTTETVDVPETVDDDGEVVVEAEQEVAVAKQVTVVADGCQREGCTEDHLPVDGAVPIIAGATDDGRARDVSAWCPFCARSVYGEDAVEGETEQLLPESLDSDGSEAESSVGWWQLVQVCVGMVLYWLALAATGWATGLVVLFAWFLVTDYIMKRL